MKRRLWLWFRHPYESMVELITQGETGWGDRG
jgi:hypothetical protein